MVMRDLAIRLAPYDDAYSYSPLPRKGVDCQLPPPTMLGRDKHKNHYEQAKLYPTQAAKAVWAFLTRVFWWRSPIAHLGIKNKER